MQVHRTEDFSSTKVLVVRRGAPFRFSLQLEGRPFNPNTDSLRIKIMLGTLDSDWLNSLNGWLIRSEHFLWFLSSTTAANCLIVSLSTGKLYVVMPVTFSSKASSSQWKAYIDPEGLDLQRPSIFISSPASASVGCYTFKLSVFTHNTRKTCAFGKFILLFNPWCRGEFVWLIDHHNLTLIYC